MIRIHDFVPQEAYPKVSTETIALFVPEEQRLLRGAFQTLSNDRSPAGSVGWMIDELCEQHGWYVTCGTLSIILAHRFTADQIPDLPILEGRTRTLLELFTLGAASENAGAWMIPLATLASIGKRGAQAFLVCVVFCAACAVLREGSQE